MSRFSLSEAKGKGWQIVHDSGRDVPVRSIVAEKAWSTPNGTDILLHEEAATIGLLLERVFAWEALHPNADSS